MRTGPSIMGAPKSIGAIITFFFVSIPQICAENFLKNFGNGLILRAKSLENKQFYYFYKNTERLA
jgi:hypothetical protein